jgi:hypothetical protein
MARYSVAASPCWPKRVCLIPGTHWVETSYLIQSLPRIIQETAKQEYDGFWMLKIWPGCQTDHHGRNRGDRIVVCYGRASQDGDTAREQGVNGQPEMAHVFTKAGF